MSKNLIYGIAILAAMAGCQKPDTTTIAKPPAVPKNSAIMVSIGAPRYTLGHQAYQKLSEYILEKYKCNEFKINSAEDVNSDKQLLIDTWGRLLKGFVSEKWNFTMCGKKHSVSLIFTPNGDGTTDIAIVE